MAQGGTPKVLQKRDVFCRQLLGECLSTHEELKDEDIIFALNVLESNKARFIDIVSDEHLAILTIHLCKNTDIGKFSLIYNFEIDVAIIRRDKERWFELLGLSHEMIFLEFYGQLENFTETEKGAITRSHTREYNAAYRLIKEGSRANIPYMQYLIQPCPRIKDTSKFKVSGILDPQQARDLERDLISSPFQEGLVMADGRRKVTLYQECMQGVCLKEEAESESKFLSTDNLDTVVVPGAIGMGKGNNIQRSARCFKMITLIDIISKEPAIDPLTNKVFENWLLDTLRNRFAKEVKMYRYYLKVINDLYPQ